MRTREDYHRALVVNRKFYMPSLKSAICTNDYMEGVRDGTIWCPLYKDIRLLPQPRVVTKSVLIGELVKVLN